MRGRRQPPIRRAARSCSGRWSASAKRGVPLGMASAWVHGDAVVCATLASSTCAAGGDRAGAGHPPGSRRSSARGFDGGDRIVPGRSAAVPAAPLHHRCRQPEHLLLPFRASAWAHAADRDLGRAEAPGRGMLCRYAGLVEQPTCLVSREPAMRLPAGPDARKLPPLPSRAVPPDRCSPTALPLSRNGRTRSRRRLAAREPCRAARSRSRRHGARKPPRTARRHPRRTRSRSRPCRTPR